MLVSDARTTLAKRFRTIKKYGDPEGWDSMLNIVSLILGACAWLFAGLAIATPKVFASHRNTLVSFGLCAASLVFQFFEMYHRVLLGDYAAIEDTIRAVLIASVVLVFITVILNLVAVAKAKNK